MAKRIMEELVNEEKASSNSKTHDATVISYTGVEESVAPHVSKENGGQEATAVSGHSDR